MMKIIGLGEYAVSDNREDIIKTYALASCIGLVIYDSKEKRLGMVHIVLPDKPRVGEEDSRKRLGFFADTAVPLLFEKVFGGYPDESRPYQVSLYGGAASNKKDDMFCIGERNLDRIEEILKENNIYYTKKNTGGRISRTIEAYVEDGKIIVYQQDITF